MRSNLKLVINNPHNKIEEKQFFEKNELKINSLLFEFINNEVIPGTDINIENFGIILKK